MKDIKQTYVGVDNKRKLFYWDGDKYVEVLDEKGGGGSSDYSDLENKPTINSVELSGNKSSADLNLQEKLTINPETTGEEPLLTAITIDRDTYRVGGNNINYNKFWQIDDSISNETPVFLLYAEEGDLILNAGATSLNNCDEYTEICCFVRYCDKAYRGVVYIDPDSQEIEITTENSYNIIAEYTKEDGQITSFTITEAHVINDFDTIQTMLKNYYMDYVDDNNPAPINHVFEIENAPLIDLVNMLISFDPECIAALLGLTGTYSGHPLCSLGFNLTRSWSPAENTFRTLPLELDINIETDDETGDTRIIVVVNNSRIDWDGTWSFVADGSFYGHGGEGEDDGSRLWGTIHVKTLETEEETGE